MAKKEKFTLINLGEAITSFVDEMKDVEKFDYNENCLTLMRVNEVKNVWKITISKFKKKKYYVVSEMTGRKPYSVVMDNLFDCIGVFGIDSKQSKALVKTLKKQFK